MEGIQVDLLMAGYIELSEEHVKYLTEDGECWVDLPQDKHAILLKSHLPNFDKVVAGEVEDVVFLRGRTYKVGVVRATTPTHN